MSFCIPGCNTLIVYKTGSVLNTLPIRQRIQFYINVYHNILFAVKITGHSLCFKGMFCAGKIPSNLETPRHFVWGRLGWSWCNAVVKKFLNRKGNQNPCNYRLLKHVLGTTTLAVRLFAFLLLLRVDDRKVCSKHSVVICLKAIEY